jgi:glycosyltransferase involved in cell wall biosynthesis
MRDETILILANAEWDWETRLNCHHLAARLARANDVLFVDTIGGRTPAPREFRKVWRRLRRIAGGVRTIEPRLRVLAPFIIPIYGSRLFRRINDVILGWQIRRAMPPKAKPILWTFLPAHVGLAGKLNEKLVIYHCVDEHSANPNVPTGQVIENEQRLLKLADIVFTTARTLYASKRALNPNTFYLPNVADVEYFAQARQKELRPPPELDRVSHPIAGFIGNITAYKLDFDLLEAAAEQNSLWAFVFIGPVGRGDPSTNIAKLAAHKNIIFLGPRPYGELASYVKSFDACLIPFRLSDSTRGTLPMKFFEYLAAGKPVIATDLPALAEFHDSFYAVRDVREFSAALAQALAEHAAQAEERVSVARKYSWEVRMAEIEQIFETRGKEAK